jgi:hypothetical protein
MQSVRQGKYAEVVTGGFVRNFALESRTVHGAQETAVSIPGTEISKSFERKRQHLPLCTIILAVGGISNEIAQKLRVVPWQLSQSFEELGSLAHFAPYFPHLSF